jgi:leucyl aminopeptidase
VDCGSTGRGFESRHPPHHQRRHPWKSFLLDKTIENVQCPIAILLYEDDQSNLNFLKDLVQDVKLLMSAENFKGKEGSTAKLNLLRDGKVITLYLGGLGPKEKAHIDIFRRATALIVKRAKKDKVQSLFMYAGENLDEKTTQAITEGAILGDYRFDKYKTQKEEEETKLSTVEIYKGDERGIRIGQILANAQRFVRDLGQ